MIRALSNNNTWAVWHRVTFVLIFLVYQVVALAQGQTVAQKNLTWYSAQCQEKHSGTTMHSPTRIEVHAGVSVDLVIQEQTISYTIESITGSWADEVQDGALEYVIKYDNAMSGKMRIEKSGGRTVVSVDMTQASPDGIHYDFFIDRVTNN